MPATPPTDPTPTSSISTSPSDAGCVPPTLPRTSTPPLEATHVHAFYDVAAAAHFSATRHTPWPRVSAFLRALPAGSLVLDLGCGNGRQLSGCGAGVACLGLDRSVPLATITHSKGHPCIGGDVLRPPLRRGVADAVLCIAVLHHLSTPDRRREGVLACLRLLAPGGRAYFTGWATEQGPTSKRDLGVGEGEDGLLVSWRLPPEFPLTDAARAAAGGVPDEHGGVTLQRFVHPFRDGELPSLLAEAGLVLAGEGVGVTLVEAWWERDNQCAIVQRAG